MYLELYHMCYLYTFHYNLGCAILNDFDII